MRCTRQIKDDLERIICDQAELGSSVLVAFDLDDTLLFASSDCSTDDWFAHALSKNAPDVVQRIWEKEFIGTGKAFAPSGAVDLVNMLVCHNIELVVITARPQHTSTETRTEFMRVYGYWPFREIFHTENKKEVLHTLASTISPHRMIVFVDDDLSHIESAQTLSRVHVIHAAVEHPSVCVPIVHYLRTNSDPRAWEDLIVKVFGVLPQPMQSFSSFLRTLGVKECRSVERGVTFGVSISGHIGAGKTTVANVFQSRGYTSVSFADALKNVVAWLFTLPRHLLEGDTDESRLYREDELQWPHGKPATAVEGLTPRRVLQLFGTDVGRVLDAEIWIRFVIETCSGPVVIPDARFPNELEAAKRMGLNTIHVTRPRAGANDMQVHVSESALDNAKFDYTISNEGTRDELVRQALQFASKLQ